MSVCKRTSLLVIEVPQLHCIDSFQLRRKKKEETGKNNHEDPYAFGVCSFGPPCRRICSHEPQSKAKE